MISAMKNQLLLAKIESARQAIAESESGLETVLRDLQLVPRAEKTKISEVVEGAFMKLQTARTNLLDLEKLLTTDEDGT